MQIKLRNAPVRFAPMGSDKQQSCLSSAARIAGDDQRTRQYVEEWPATPPNELSGGHLGPSAD